MGTRRNRGVLGECGRAVVLSALALTAACQSQTGEQVGTSATHAVASNRNVLLIDIDPVLPSQGGTHLTTFKHWDSPVVSDRANQIATWFTSISNGKLTFNVASQQLIEHFVPLVDGYTYDDVTYLAVAGGAPPHQPQGVDYGSLIASTGACDLVNSGQIDEIWLFGAPWFGFYESTLAGPNGYWYNSPPITGTTCNKLVPVMGFSYERGLTEAIHDFGHRTESTMQQLYGGWRRDGISTSWDAFSLVSVKAPSLGISGCGDTHFAPNSTADYDYSNTTPVNSFCDDFLNYPNLNGNPASVATPVTCAAWGCTELGYHEWWYRHLPHADGVAPDGKLNDWWPYVADPNAVFNMPNPGPGPTCSSTGAACGSDSDCCAGNQCIAGTCGTPPPPSCSQAGGPCSANTDCCAGNVCLMGQCGAAPTCSQTGGPCAADADCCAGTVCVSGQCGTPPSCMQTGGACVADADCCAGSVCVNGQCGTTPTGSPNWAQCSQDSDCQSGVCGCNGSTPPAVCLPNSSYPRTCVSPNWAPCNQDSDCQSGVCGCNGGPPPAVCLPNDTYPRTCT